MNGNLNDLQKWLRRLGAVMAGASVAMTFTFGFLTPDNVIAGLVFGSFLACVTLGSAYLAPFIPMLWSRKAYGSMAAACLGLVICSGADFISNLGFAGGQRAFSAQKASVQNVRFDDTRDNVKENKALLASFEKQHAALLEQSPWAPTVSADGLRAKLTALEEKRRQEETRGGCGPICLSVMDEIADANNRIKTAETLTGIKDRIAAISKVLVSLREKSGVTQKGHSFATAQNETMASLVSWSETTSSETRFTASTLTNLMIAIAATFGTLLINYFGWWGFSWSEPTPTPAPGTRHTTPSPPRRNPNPVPALNRDWTGIDQIIADAKAALTGHGIQAGAV